MMEKRIWALVKVHCGFNDTHVHNPCPTQTFSNISPPELCESCGYSEDEGLNQTPNQIMKGELNG